jgi:EAL domain-containing protein (putative c-di-GMP-specific phosphodiesterase class I)/CheY-like chemotaxis protein
MHSILGKEGRPGAATTQACVVSQRSSAPDVVADLSAQESVSNVDTTETVSGVVASECVESGTKDETKRILLVDDQPSVLRSMARVLALRGYTIETATNGLDAIRLVATTDFDVVVSDIAMPEMDGIRLLREIRAHDLYVPVILMTGEPTVDTAVKALEYGAIHYLTKPFQLPLLESMLEKAIGLRKMTDVRLRAAEALGQDPPHAADRSGLETSFQRMLGTLWVAFQPIVDAVSTQCVGYEALLRSDEPSLPHPAAVLEAAKRLGQLETVGRAMRDRVAEMFGGEGRPELLFVNLHIADLLDPHLLSPNSALSKLAPQVVLEITDRAIIDGITDVSGRIAALRELGYRVAIDDLGAGYSGLTTYALVEPDFIKLDMDLIRNIDKMPIQQHIVRSVVGLCEDMGNTVVVEGVETLAEYETLRELGCRLFQGFLFGRPGPGFPQSHWPVGTP